MSTSFGVLIDLDQTLVDSSALKPLRDARDWRQVHSSLHLSQVYEFADSFLGAINRSQLPYGIVTSAPRAYAESMIRHHGLQVPVVTAFHDTREHKPHAAPLVHGLQALGVSMGVYIGDDDIDARAAESAGIKFLKVDHAIGQPLKDLAAAVFALATQSTR
jgi:phosphoglycolate phosphatase-like HAD superfamily hydrolase